MTRWSAITRTRARRSALAYGSRSTTGAETTSTGSYTTSGDATRPRRPSRDTCGQPCRIARRSRSPHEDTFVPAGDADRAPVAEVADLDWQQSGAVRGRVDLVDSQAKRTFSADGVALHAWA